MAMERRAPEDLQEAVAATLRRLRGELGPSPQPGMQRPPAVGVPANQRTEPTLPFGGPEAAQVSQPAQAPQPAQPDLLSRAEAGSEIPPNPSQRLAELREVLARPDRAEHARPRLLPYALSGMAVILFAGIGWWTYSSISKPHNSAQVPLVVADQTPEKVPPPANQAASEPTASSNKTIYNDVAPGTAPPPPSEVLLPAPTVPDVPATGGTASDANSAGTNTTGATTTDTGSTAAASSGSAATDTGTSAAASGSDLALTPVAPATGTTSDSGSGSNSGATSMSTTDTGSAAATSSQAPAAATTTDTGSAATAPTTGTASTTTTTATTTADNGAASTTGTGTGAAAANGSTGSGMTETLIPSASGTDTGTASSQTPEVAATGSAATSGTDTSGSAATGTGTSDNAAQAPAVAAPAPAPAEVYDLSGAPASVPRLAPLAVSDAGDTAASSAALQPLAPEPTTTQPATSSAATTTASTDTGASGTTAAPATQAALGNFRIQLAALKTEADAKATWKRLSVVHSDLLGGLSYHIEKVALSSGTYYRLQAGPFTDRAAAADVCVKLKAQGQQCLVKP